MDKKEKLGDMFEKAQAELDKLEGQMDSIDKDIKKISDDENASVKYNEGDDIDTSIKNWEEFLKINQSIDKQSKAVFDSQMKLYESYTKKVADTLAAVKKEVAAANAAMDSSNAQLNGLEVKMRSTIDGYVAVAQSMNRAEIGAACRSFLPVFTKGA